MAALTKSLIVRHYFGQYESVWMYLLNSSLDNDSPIRIRYGLVLEDRGFQCCNTDKRTKLYKWIFKHYGGTKKSII